MNNAYADNIEYEEFEFLTSLPFLQRGQPGNHGPDKGFQVSDHTMQKIPLTRMNCRLMLRPPELTYVRPGKYVYG